MARRLVRLSVAVAAGLLVASCASTGGFIADTLPDWAGGLPRGTPPRAGEPGYDAYQKAIRGDAPATAQSADTPASAQPVETPARKPKEPLAEPIH